MLLCCSLRGESNSTFVSGWFSTGVVSFFFLCAASTVDDSIRARLECDIVSSCPRHHVEQQGHFAPRCIQGQSRDSGHRLSPAQPVVDGPVDHSACESIRVEGVFGFVVAR